MDIKDTSKLVSRIKEDVEFLKCIVGKETSDARLLLDHKIHTSFKDEFEKITSDMSTVEVNWARFGLPNPHAKKMVLMEKDAQGNRVKDSYL